MARITSPKVRQSLFTKKQNRVFEVLVMGDFAGWPPDKKADVKLLKAYFTAKTGSSTVNYTLAKWSPRKPKPIVVYDTYVKLRLKPKSGKQSSRPVIADGTPVTGTFTVTLSLGPRGPVEYCSCEAIDFEE